MEKIDELVQALIMQALEENPQGLTEKQILNYVDKKMKKIKKIIDIFNKI